LLFLYSVLMKACILAGFRVLSQLKPSKNLLLLIVYLIIGLMIGLLSGWYVANAKLSLHSQTVQAKLEGSQQQLNEVKKELLLANNQNSQLGQDFVRLETVNQHLTEKLGAQKQEVEAMQEKLTVQFRNLANDLLEEKSKKFTDQNKVNLEGLLKPLGERIQAFEKQVVQTNKESLERNVALRTEVKKLSELNAQITKEAENLTKAIKGDTKTQGNWGEFILERILEKSGLARDREYSVQTSFLTEEGKRYQPDVIIKLPEGKHIIIDAKVSLVNYEQFFNTEQSAARELALKKHIQSLRKHIKELSEKNYQSEYDLKGLDFVLMFVPIEPAFSLAVQHDLALFNEAYEKNIVLVSPTTLMATLRTIANIWKHEYQSQNALEIAQQGGALYDKFVGFVEDLKHLGRQMDLTQKAYAEAMKKLYEGKGNLVRRAQNIKTLGARTSKALDSKLVDRADAYEDNAHE
jgi:DNA recombination protein RmuC